MKWSVINEICKISSICNEILVINDKAMKSIII